MTPHATADDRHGPYTYLFRSDPRGGYTGEILELPGCYAEGETADATMHALRRAAVAWIRAAVAHRQEVPRPFRTQGASGKIALRLPTSLHRHAAHLAARDGVSLNEFLVATLAREMGAQEGAEAFATHVTTQLGQGLRDA